MVSVVIDDQHAIDFTLRLEPAAGAREAVKSFYDLFERDFQLESHRDRCEGVVDVVHPRHAQDHFADDICSTPDGKGRTEVVVVADSMSRDVCLRAQAIRQAPALEKGNNCLYVWIVETQ